MCRPCSNGGKVVDGNVAKCCDSFFQNFREDPLCIWISDSSASPFECMHVSLPSHGSCSKKIFSSLFYLLRDPVLVLKTCSIMSRVVLQRSAMLDPGHIMYDDVSFPSNTPLSSLELSVRTKDLSFVFTVVPRIYLSSFFRVDHRDRFNRGTSNSAFHFRFLSGCCWTMLILW